LPRSGSRVRAPSPAPIFQAHGFLKHMAFSSTWLAIGPSEQPTRRNAAVVRGRDASTSSPPIGPAKHDAALWLDVNGLERACVFLFPASLVDEKPPQLLMGLHPKHRIDPVFLEHRVPGRLIDRHVGDQFEIVTQ
jgi:hypothetical protein